MGDAHAAKVAVVLINPCKLARNQPKPKASTAKEKRVLATPKFTLLLFLIYRVTFLGMFQFKISYLSVVAETKKKVSSHHYFA